MFDWKFLFPLGSPGGRLSYILNILQNREVGLMGSKVDTVGGVNRRNILFPASAFTAVAVIPHGSKYAQAWRLDSLQPAASP